MLDVTSVYLRYITNTFSPFFHLNVSLLSISSSCLLWVVVVKVHVVDILLPADTTNLCVCVCVCVCACVCACVCVCVCVCVLDGCVCVGGGFFYNDGRSVKDPAGSLGGYRHCQ